MTPDDYRGFEKDKIAENPKLQLAWDLAQIIDDGAPIGWWKHVGTATCLLAGYEMKRKGWGEPDYSLTDPSTMPLEDRE